ncbi:hypothetical protein DHEL01_v209038 [Diaporthe helianthi]|uniref:Uncharacterized protein n=1 Tax=Diaporthe helianthi TaxID=158607 RepID=A0A2P5HQR8_DIAHE|nr:hypothetical protein DHEL01_v209038 [Diaporthe helianthi]
MGPPRILVGEQTTLLSAADCNFLEALQDSLPAEAANGRGCGGLLTAILDHLDRFKEHLHADGAGTEHDQYDNVWGPVMAEACTSRGKSEVTITGPGPEDRFHVPVTSPEDASRTVAQLAFVVGIDAVTAESTVDEHINLLRQYNKVKDVGQQLIGLNADNRGVPVGSLYADEHYGVGPHD